MSCVFSTSVSPPYRIPPLLSFSLSLWNRELLSVFRSLFMRAGRVGRRVRTAGQRAGCCCAATVRSPGRTLISVPDNTDFTAGGPISLEPRSLASGPDFLQGHRQLVPEGALGFEEVGGGDIRRGLVGNILRADTTHTQDTDGNYVESKYLIKICQEIICRLK